MTCKQSIVSLLDELLRLFADSDANKVTYRLLIMVRHKVRNTLSDQDILQACKNFHDKHMDRMVHNDITIFNGTEHAIIAEMVWNVLSPANKELIWKWGQTIISSYLV